MRSILPSVTDLACSRGRRRHFVLILPMLVSGLIASSANAQIPSLPSSPNISHLIGKVFFPAELIVPPVDSTPQETYAQQRRDSLDGVAVGLGTALASFPLGASSAGFTYVTDPNTGDRTLKTVSFGPQFLERATTNGRGVVNLGVNFQVSSFDTLQGVDLKDVGFPTYSQLGTYADGSGVGDVFHSRLKVNSRIAVFSGSYGLTDRFDFGWAVPVASVEVQGQFVRDYNGGRDWDNDVPGGPIRSFYPNKVGQQTWIDETISASGIGDVVVRAKFGLGPASRQRGLVAGELRLPTGDNDNLLGTGKTSFRLITGGSAIAGPAAFNVNAGYTFGGLTDEINFAAGTELALLPRKQLTITLDVIGQTLRDSVTTFTDTIVFNQFITDRQVVVSYRFWDRGSTTLARAAIGAKYAIANNWLLTASALFRLNDNGYQARIVPFVGLERTWSR